MVGLAFIVPAGEDIGAASSGGWSGRWTPENEKLPSQIRDGSAPAHPAVPPMLEHKAPTCRVRIRPEKKCFLSSNQYTTPVIEGETVAFYLLSPRDGESVRGNARGSIPR